MAPVPQNTFLDRLSSAVTKIIDLFLFSWIELSFLDFLELYMLNTSGEFRVHSGAKEYI